MAKYLVLIGLVLFFWWTWQRSRANGQQGHRRPPDAGPERMVPCARCGVNLPLSESIMADDRYYCCRAHLHESRSGNG
ncbi:PP0621 family protein [Accumulibacter sp.]|uniref:PP0621 family protein n=1 Tax=Accumulibacter sp. TaxID=2053492 RepID=UPI0025E7DB85|nr:PP0621 family protein [Accumulibacter sp.]MCM8594171.1 hypothetical protein [Accumulibacter sp.]MCM8625733.1 hypothetical protein [Accumulibacter sp.]MDS4048314.1 PP0621 family protein [Accumulibacter sp.]